MAVGYTDKYLKNPCLPREPKFLKALKTLQMQGFGVLKVQNRGEDSMKKSVVLALVVALLLVHFSSALDIQSVSFTDTLSEDLSMEETVAIAFSNPTSDHFQFSLPSGAKSILVNGEPFASQDNFVNVSIECSACTLNISYELPDTVKKGTGDFSIFSRTISLPITPDNIHYEILLPPGQVISSSATGEPPIVPTPTGITTNGKNIIIYWDEHSPKLPTRYFVEYQGHETTESTLFEITNEFTEWPVLVLLSLFLIIGIIVGIYGYKYFRHRFSYRDLPYVPSSLLSKDEKTVTSVLRDANGWINQKDIGKKLSWSKSKVSAVISNLDYKKVVEREKSGRNYKVRLIKEIEE